MSEIEGRTWQLTSGVATDAGTPITARFVDGTLSGSNGTVHYRSDYDSEGDSLRIGPPSTSRAVTEAGGGREFVTLLDAVGAARPAADRLELLDRDGRAILTFAAAPEVPSSLVARWTVRSIARDDHEDTAVGDAGAEATAAAWLEIAADGTVNGSSGVNRLSGRARADGDRLFLGPLRSTRMGGDQGAMEAESALMTALEDVAGYRASGDRLELLDGDGATKVRLQRG